MLPRNHGERIFSCSYRYGFLKIETPGIRKLRHKVKGSDRVTFRLRETTTPHDDNHLLAPFQRYICAYDTTRDGRPQLAAVLGREPGD